MLVSVYYISSHEKKKNIAASISIHYTGLCNAQTYTKKFVSYSFGTKCALVEQKRNSALVDPDS